ncbi:DUF6785 family protein [Candidatus Poribacteria bacterium]
MKYSSFSYRSLILALILIPVNAYWIIKIEFLRFPGFISATCISLFLNVVFVVFALVMLNAVILRVCPKLALKQGEVLIVYYMLSISSFVAGEEIIQTITSLMGHVFWFATPENEWEMFHRYLPELLTIRDRSILEALYESQNSAYPAGYVDYIKSWLPVVMVWSVFLTVLVFTMYCLNVILRKQWMDNERLTYPVVRLPLELIRDNGSLKFFRQRALLMGLGLATFINLLNGISFLYPNVPGIPIKRHSIQHLFVSKPWNAIGEIHVAFYPFVIGLGFLIPAELSFSCWFFYLLHKATLILGKATGLSRSAISLHPNEQMLGAYIGVLLVALWSGRKHFIRVLSCLFRPAEGRDSGEPMSYRSAVLSALTGFILLIAFSVACGMSLWVAVLFFALYFGIAMSITRLRAELGAPVHDLWSIGSTGPDTFITGIFGTRILNRNTLGMLTLHYGISYEYRGHVMPHQLESLKVADALKLRWKRFGTATIIAAFLGSLAAFWAIFHLCYSAEFPIGRTWGAYDRLQRWFFYPSDYDLASLGFFTFGAVFTIALMIVRSRLIWFHFHPLGYALAPGWTMNFIWLPLFISWLIKISMLKYGGLRVLRRSTPFFLGLILGDFVVGVFWILIGIAIRTPTYAFWF